MKYIVKLHHTSDDSKYTGYLKLVSEHLQHEKDLGFYTFLSNEDIEKAEIFDTVQMAKFAIMLARRDISHVTYEIIEVDDDNDADTSHTDVNKNKVIIYNLIEECLYPDGERKAKVLKAYYNKEKAKKVRDEMRKTNIIELNYYIVETEVDE